MSKTTTLVTGGAGYIGSHAVLALREAGWPVIVIDDLSTGDRSLVPDDVEFHRLSTFDRAAVEQLMKARGVGALLHFAASIVVPDSVAQPLEYYSNNVVGSHSLIGAAVGAGVKHVIFSSTAAVYGMNDAPLIDEAQPIAPINPYGASKAMVERMLGDCAAAYGFNVGILRYFNVAGADPQLRSGQKGKGSTHLIKVAVEAATGKRPAIAVYGDDYPTPDGTCVRDYIHVSDLADAHVLALERLVEQPESGLLVNCGYGHGHSVIDVLDAVDRASGSPIVRRMEGRRPGDSPSLVADNRAIRDTLAWQPRFDDLNVIVAHALAWERKITAA